MNDNADEQYEEPEEIDRVYVPLTSEQLKLALAAIERAFGCLKKD